MRTVVCGPSSMIDYLTLQVDASLVDVAARAAVQGETSRLMCIQPDGMIKWEKNMRSSVRSDSHSVTVELGTNLRIYGSPAMAVLADGHTNVFGVCDIRRAATSMLRLVEKVRGVSLPPVEAWDLRRMDVTENYDLGNITNVKTALEHLRNAEGGRYQVGTTAESVYWSTRSTVRSGKAYAKGPHLQYLNKRGKLIPAELVALAHRLLRLELSLRRHFFDRVLKTSWLEITPEDQAQWHHEYFSQLVGNMKITEHSDIRAALIKAAVELGYSEGIGAAVYPSWNLIRTDGYQAFRDHTSPRTFYRHKKIMRQAGLSYADFAARNVVPLRIRTLELKRPVQSWGELRRAA